MNINTLHNKKYFILDMDGTFYLGDKLLEGSLETIGHITGKEKNFLFLTNNSSKTPKVYVNKLKAMGCTVDESQIITSGMVTIDYLKKKYDNPKVYLLGTPILEEGFIAQGISLVDIRPDAVVVGFDTTLSYEKLSKACTFIRNGATFLATHPDLNCPTEEGPIPDCGAMCAFITAATGVQPKYLGKPFIHTLEYIIKHIGCTREELVFIGDRLNTDIAIGYNHGITSVLVLTGATKHGDVETSTVKPDLIANRLSDLIEYI